MHSVCRLMSLTAFWAIPITLWKEQRTLSESVIEQMLRAQLSRIARGYEPLVLGTLTLVTLNHHYFLVDGQHRNAMLRRLVLKLPRLIDTIQVPVAIINCLTTQDITEIYGLCNYSNTLNENVNQQTGIVYNQQVIAGKSTSTLLVEKLIAEYPKQARDIVTTSNRCSQCPYFYPRVLVKLIAEYKRCNIFDKFSLETIFTRIVEFNMQEKDRLNNEIEKITLCVDNWYVFQVARVTAMIKFISLQ